MRQIRKSSTESRLLREKGVSVDCYRYCMGNRQGCCPIVGLANELQLGGLLEALTVTLSDEDIKRLASTGIDK